MRQATLCVVLAGLGAVLLFGVARIANVRLGEDATRNDAVADGSAPGSHHCMEMVAGPNEGVSQIMAKSEVARALIRGELSLLDATHQFRELSAVDPGFLERMRGMHPNAGSDDELYARNVIRHVEVELMSKPECEAICQRLEAEMIAQLNSANGAN